MADPAIAPAPQTPADERLDRLAAARFTAVMARHPVYASFLGLHEHDDALGDASREAVMAEIDESRAFLGALEEIDPASLSPYFATERELALFVTRRALFDAEVHRVWERRASASDEIGDGIFLLFARGGRPLVDRLASIASRLEAAPLHLEQARSRFGQRPPMRLWNEMELEAVESLPLLFDEVASAARRELGDGHRETRRIEQGASAARAALADYAAWLKNQVARADDDFALGSADYDTLVGLRAFDNLSTDDILAIGEEQLAAERAARKNVAREIDASATEQEVVDRVKSDHPADFVAALEAYRSAMSQARQFVIDRHLVTLPPGEHLSVIETPEYLRAVMPFAAYYAPGKFDTGAAREGLYIVTPSVDGAAGALREHSYASIYNTSIHEAYPGHHVQLAAANEHPSLTRLLVDAPEFVEGWAMYCELMMREQGFDTAPSHRLMMHTDAIWRACRIILDVKLQRGQIGVREATDFLVEQTGFERPNAEAEVKRYTYTPTYQLSYLLGRVLILRLRSDEQRRLGERFSLRGFHDALLAQGGLPVSFQRRLLLESA